MSRTRILFTLPRARDLAMFAFAYAIAFKLGDHTYGSLAVASPFWLPDSVLLCTLLLAPRSEWWAYIAAIAPIRLVTGALPGTPLWFVFVATSNDAVKGIATAWLLQQLED